MRIAACFLLLASAAAANPAISPEHPVSSPVTGPGFDQQNQPAAAFGGGVFLTAWVDLRDPSRQRIYGARHDAAGTLLDPAGLALSTGTGVPQAPALSSDGTNFLLVYVESTTTGDHVVAQRIGPDGSVLDATPIVLHSETESQRAPAVAFDGTNFLVVFEALSVEAVRVSKAGVVLDTAAIDLSALTSTFGLPPSVAFDGTDFVVVNKNGAVRVTSAGTNRDATAIALPGEPTDLACLSGTCALVWGTYGKVEGVRLASTGALLDASAVTLVSTAGTSDTAEDVKIAVSGSGYTVLEYEDSTTTSGMKVRAAHVTASLQQGTPIDVWTTADKVGDVALASDGTTAWLTWDAYIEFQENRGDVLGARASATALLDAQPLLVSVGAVVQQGPAVAFDGTNTLVVWQELRPGTEEDIFAARVDANGAVIDTTPLSIAATSDREREPAVAFDGTNYLVVWGTWFGGLWGRRVSPAGQLLGAAFQIDDPYNASKNNPSVAFDGVQLQVAYEIGDNASLKRVSTAGAVLDATALSLPSSGSYNYSPSIACDGTNCLVAWEGDGLSTGEIYARRVSRAGMLVDAMPFALGEADDTAARPHVAFDGTGYVVVWESISLQGARVSAAGAVLDMPPKDYGDGSNPVLAWDGTQFTMAWLTYDQVSGTGFAVNWLDTTASLVDPSATVQADTRPLAQPAIVSVAPGRALFAYSVFDGSAQFNNWRVRYRLIDRGGLIPDAGQMPPPDAGTPDAGAPDAGLQDAGMPDAGTPPGMDAGMMADAGTPPAADGGTPPGAETPHGCGCDQTAGALAWLIIAVVARRRRA
jgi:hypothetical protein